MTTVEDLRALVAARFERLDLPAWAGSRVDGREPAAEEYSRVTDPGRYRVVHARARLWAEVLAETTGAVVEELGRLPAEGDLAAVDRAVRVTPRAAGALPLLLLERDVRAHPDDEVLPVLEVAVVRREMVLDTLPDCGCDACDSGSADLLEAVDLTIAPVVAGPYVVLRGPGWSAQWHPDGGRGSGDARMPDFGLLTARARDLAAGRRVRLPRRTEAVVGGSWLGTGA